ncbi:hypothetical protein Sipo8835_29540 [Streptomyces ipomoeae]|jgi:hypothetical protein|uniref:Uncharacterized protein n=2 Tax=Streptomyces ipomoeae TaxID=103232 RepID=L1KJ35_9ACTN|nr:hypothetical protein [Streptomyces ipomoeae]EKX60796.1 hypothetical protein STRIP9103_04171 [Streptomyces ipomoeae 91-03]MDX2696536.1 hypothetical protein [Streptomyces ipomoeae]MDX2824630.1 hypothetical protein [Streptomyces ipomoeae]MDX2841942.1 hypothetical protein [Streptomyces ipomoeae]MDX2879408.1 hypothetical protein [Streptomyces ipomoeae]
MKPPTKRPLKSRKALLRGALAVTAAGLAAVLPLAGTAGATPLSGKAQRTVTTADGDTFRLRLKASPVVLPATGGTVKVKGAGYNRAQGIFLAFCVIPDGVKVGDPSTYTTLPSPCLGGREAQDGSSRRITDTGTGTPGITIPYEEGGRFRTTLNLRPEIADGKVCGQTVRCAIVTRADFTATNSRLYDQYIPVHFVPGGVQR